MVGVALSDAMATDVEARAAPQPAFSSQIVTASVVIPGSARGHHSVEVLCGEREWVTGGGFEQTSDFDVRIPVIHSRPVAADTDSGLAGGGRRLPSKRATET